MEFEFSEKSRRIQQQLRSFMTEHVEPRRAEYHRLVEDGMTDLDDVLKDRLNSLKAERDRARAAFEAAKVQIAPAIRIDPALIERFGRGMREKFSNGSVPFRKAYLQSLIDLVEVDGHRVRIMGRKDVLERAVVAAQTTESGSQMSTRWRARRDSNS